MWECGSHFEILCKIIDPLESDRFLSYVTKLNIVTSPAVVPYGCLCVCVGGGQVYQDNAVNMGEF